MISASVIVGRVMVPPPRSQKQFGACLDQSVRADDVGLRHSIHRANPNRLITCGQLDDGDGSRLADLNVRRPMFARR